MANTDDDEWEYEYDETETEDFYIPIDLSNVPDAQIPTNTTKRAGHPTLIKSRLRALNAVRGQLPDTAAGDATSEESPTVGELQIVDLHTENPLLMYNGQLLSCHWTETVGTDMFFTRPGAGAGDLGTPLRSLPAVDLLSLGTAKLVAKVGRLRPRDDVIDEENHDPMATDGMTIATADEAAADTDASNLQSSEVAQETGGVTQSLPVSTGFLARLNEIKLSRGENTKLVVNNNAEGSSLLAEYFDAERIQQARSSNDI